MYTEIATDRAASHSQMKIQRVVLWVIASAAGGRVGVGYRALRRGTGAPASAAIHAAMAVAVALLLIDMIYKPGA